VAAKLAFEPISSAESVRNTTLLVGWKYNEHYEIDREVHQVSTFPFEKNWPCTRLRVAKTRATSTLRARILSFGSDSLSPSNAEKDSRECAPQRRHQPYFSRLPKRSNIVVHVRAVHLVRSFASTSGFVQVVLDGEKVHPLERGESMDTRPRQSVRGSGQAEPLPFSNLVKHWNQLNTH